MSRACKNVKAITKTRPKTGDNHETEPSESLIGRRKQFFDGSPGPIKKVQRPAPAPDAENDRPERERKKLASQEKRQRHPVEHDEDDEDGALVASPAPTGESENGQPTRDSESTDFEQVLSPELIPADLAELTDQLRASLDAARIAVRTTVHHAIRSGHLLAEARRRVGHGRFESWLAETLPEISASSARNYMRVARNEALLLKRDPNRQPAPDLNLAAALKMLAKPRGKGTGRKPRTSAKSGAMTGAADSSDDTQTLGPEAADDSNAGAGEVVVDVEFETESESASNGSAGQTSDEEWLKTLPIRSQLANPEIFEQEALLNRRLQPAIDHLRGLYELTPEDAKNCLINTRFGNRYAKVVARLIGVRPPEQWRLCWKCKGSCNSPALKTPCIVCEGAGFEIPHVGESSYDPEGTREGR